MSPSLCQVCREGSANRSTNPVLADALLYYAERRTMTNPKGWEHVRRVVQDALAAGVYRDATDDQVATAMSTLADLIAAERAETEQRRGDMRDEVRSRQAAYRYAQGMALAARNRGDQDNALRWQHLLNLLDGEADPGSQAPR